jgi:hypothetical protein
MSKIYKLEEGVILRSGEAIATYNEANGEVDYFEGMAKYRIPVSKWLNKAVKTPKVTQREVVETEKDGNWLDYLSAIVGVKLPYPHSKKGWRGTKYRDVLMKNYNKIIKSDALTNEEKKVICNQFL